MVRPTWRKPANALLLLILLLGGPLAAPAAGVAVPQGEGGGAVPGATIASGTAPERADGIDLPTGAEVGWLTVPRLGLERFPIRMGTGDEILADSVGLYPGSEAPDSQGNFATAGHRVTPVGGMWHGPYYDLDLLVAGDQMTLGYEGAVYRYRFAGSTVVEPDAVWVLDDDRADLTMTACHPKGSIDQRIVAWWDLIRPEVDPSFRSAAVAARAG